MDVGSELRRLLADELCAMMEGWTQGDAAAMPGLRQPHLSRLRRRNRPSQDPEPA